MREMSARNAPWRGWARDGVLRCHTIMRDGFVRDTVNYSFTMNDWPARKIPFEDYSNNSSASTECSPSLPRFLFTES